MSLPANGIAAKRGKTIWPETAIATLPGLMPFSRTISRSAGARIVPALPESSGAASAAVP